MKKEEQNMDERLEQYISSYQELLTEKGYDEVGLNNGAAPGAMADNIDKAFRQMVEATHKKGEDTVAVVKCLGYFDQKRETIMLDFAFHYNQKEKTIKLITLRAETHDLKLTFLGELNSKVPEFSEVLGHIKKAREELAVQPKQKPKPPRPKL